MRFLILLAFTTGFILISEPLSYAQEGKKAPEKAILPDTWHGDWVGKMKIAQPGGKSLEVYAGLEIRPLKEKTGYTWIITYGEGDKQQVRKYELIPDDKGSFEVDEKNGIRISARLFDDILTTLFQVGDNIIHTRYQRVEDTLIMDLTTYTAKDALKTGTKGVDVTSMKPIARQVSTLKRKKE